MFLAEKTSSARTCGGREPGAVRGRWWRRPSRWNPAEKGEKTPRSERQAQRPRGLLYPRVRAKSLQSCPTLCDPMHCHPPGFFLWDSPGENSGADHHTLLQEIFLTQASNPRLTSPALAGRFFTTSAFPGKKLGFYINTTGRLRGFWAEQWTMVLKQVLCV